ncbi:MAG: hypothetical protein JNL11_09700 [Bdellovibrionaceae bacterium]|nr:hypothetical protein [Pseudobdellovibrionaceae bacterium]
MNSKQKLRILFGLMIFLILTPLVRAEVSRPEIERVFQAFQKAYGDELRQKNQSLFFNRPIGYFDWLDLDLAHASYIQIQSDSDAHIFHEITLVGGLLKLPNFDMDAAVLVLCHELGHGLGGEPFKSLNEPDSDTYLSSTEGQADYFATQECLPKLWKVLPASVQDYFPAAETKCRSQFTPGTETHSICLRSFAAMRGFLQIHQNNQPMFLSADFQSHDPYTATEINRGSRYYPSAQCRLDTLMAGALAQPRPPCWYKL